MAPSDVKVDERGPNFIGDSTQTEEQIELGRAVASSLSEQVVAKFKERGIQARRTPDATVPPLHAMVIKGQFVTIDEGDQTMRTVIGFGAGETELRAFVQVYQQTETGLRRIAEAEAEAHGTKKPGMAVPVAGMGAVAGRAATAAAVSGGMALVTEVKGDMKATISAMAEEMAERAAAFYAREGWL